MATPNPIPQNLASTCSQREHILLVAAALRVLLPEQVSDELVLKAAELADAILKKYPPIRAGPAYQESKLLSVKQFEIAEPAFTQAALRNLIFKAEARHSSTGLIPGNGLVECGAIVRVGRKVLIDRQKFLNHISKTNLIGTHHE